MNEEQKRIAALQLAATFIAPTFAIDKIEKVNPKEIAFAVQETLIGMADELRPVIDSYLNR